MKQTNGPAEQRIYRDLRLLFAPASIELLCPGEGLTAPRVSFGAPAKDAEPHHVFVVSMPEDHEIEDVLTSYVQRIAFTVRVVLIATSSERASALAKANRYLDVASQVALADETLGGLTSQAISPRVISSSEWTDSNGRWHVGIALGYRCSVTAIGDPAARQILDQE